MLCLGLFSVLVPEGAERGGAENFNVHHKATTVRASISGRAVKPSWVWDWPYWLVSLKIISSLLSLQNSTSQTSYFVLWSSLHISALKCFICKGSKNALHKSYCHGRCGGAFEAGQICVCVFQPVVGEECVLTEVKYTAEYWSIDRRPCDSTSLPADSAPSSSVSACIDWLVQAGSTCTATWSTGRLQHRRLPT